MSDYQHTSLWQTGFFGPSVRTQADGVARDDLLAAYRSLEDHVEPLLRTIPESCQGLTLHDISHVRQLWSVASEICGPNYPINPLEAFVLGAAFLLHDAGLTVAAYPEGLAGLQATKFYRDRVAALLRGETGQAPSPASLQSPSKNISE